MNQPQARPEDRRRTGIDSRYGQPWADTHPGCFRSEAFAEDLPEDAPQPRAARGPRIWRWRGQGGTLPLLGGALVVMLGAFGR